MKRLDRTTFPDGKLETYTYYPDGLLKTKTDRLGQTITYAYDAFKRLKKKIYPDPAKTITYTYQGQKLTQVDDAFASPAETHTFGYDNSYRVSTNTQGPRGTLSYTYTPDDRVDTLTVAGTPNVTTAHTYYPDGSLNTIAWSPQAGLFKYSYTPRGQYQAVTFPNGQTRTYAYDDQGRLTQLANALGATNLATYAYGYDVDWATGLNTMLGQRVSMTANVPSQGFTNALTKYSYDPLYQLKKAEYPNVAPFNGEVDQWSYDAIGNRLTNQINATIQTYTYEKIGVNPKNAQKLLGDGTNSYTYDFNGSQTSRLGGANYGFVNDPDNRLASINGNETAAYTYDYQGRRTSKTVSGVTTKYLYDGLNLVSETTAGATTRYAFGPSIDEPLAVYAGGTLSYLNVDGLGSPVSTNNPAGGATSALIYDAWGTQKVVSPTRLHSFDYTGREVGEAGLLGYRTRHYQPVVGRFTGQDLLGSVDGPSLYRYVRNGPLASTDPFGLLTVNVWNYRGKHDAWGHASITLDDGTHISWWPSSRDREGLFRSLNIYDAPANDDQTLARDIEFEGQNPDSVFTINGLDERAIRLWWENFKQNHRWKTLSLNCSTVAADALRAGGAYVPFNFVWSPEDVRQLAQAILAQQQRSGTPTKAPPTYLPPPAGWSLQ